MRGKGGVRSHHASEIHVRRVRMTPIKREWRWFVRKKGFIVHLHGYRQRTGGDLMKQDT